LHLVLDLYAQLSNLLLFQNHSYSDSRNLLEIQLRLILVLEVFDQIDILSRHFDNLVHLDQLDNLLQLNHFADLYILLHYLLQLHILLGLYNLPDTQLQQQPTAVSLNLTENQWQ
jgi:hypothetical protein